MSLSSHHDATVMTGADHEAMRRLIGGTLAALMIVLLTPTVAHASWLETREERTTEFDNDPEKMITVPCPYGTAVMGAGARTRDANGQAVLTGVVPNVMLTGVTAYARALDGFDGEWALTVVAICGDREDYGLVRTDGEAIGEYASAYCEDDKVLYTTGYWIEEAAQAQYVDAVVPSFDQSWLVVHAESGTSPLELTAYGVCGYNVSPIGRTAGTVPLGLSNTAGTAPPVEDLSMVLGAGVWANVDGVFVDGIGPTETIGCCTSHARMARLYTAIPIGPFFRTAIADDDDDDEMTVYALSIGSWYS